MRSRFRRAKKILPEIRAELPSSMELKLWFDKANWIKEAIEDVEWSLVLAFALVVGVIFFSLRHSAKRLSQRLLFLFLSSDFLRHASFAFQSRSSFSSGFNPCDGICDRRCDRRS